MNQELALPEEQTAIGPRKISRAANHLAAEQWQRKSKREEINKMTETINGLHSCKPENAPQIGAIKTLIVENRTGKSGKAYLKIKSASAEMGGQPYRIVSAEKTDYVDIYGNISFNLEIESQNGQQAGAVNPTIAGQDSADGVLDTRKHLMQAVNLLRLCVRAVNSGLAPHTPEIAQTAEFFQAQVATLFIEASRSGYVSKMPDKPMPGEEPY
jgi:hypothetical protein